ncbi:MAG: antibiotic biosynthesis monooxygenase [Boseongicola sp. SB0677_bin_26]|nr:antibiotic biosynthesis monooxygenase [Boseongicola sp. SB0665_bin_10]MYG27418.1 antibiotic biosynthesis monooxygenase [Boseongicola sp. SB0677_bin_26]
MAATEPYVVLVEFELLPDASMADARELLAQNASASFRNEPGCLRFDVVETQDEAAAFTLYEVYADEAAFTAHLNSPHFLAFDQESGNFFGGKSVRLGRLTTEASAA